MCSELKKKLLFLPLRIENDFFPAHRVFIHRSSDVIFFRTAAWFSIWCAYCSHIYNVASEIKRSEQQKIAAKSQNSPNWISSCTCDVCHSTMRLHIFRSASFFVVIVDFYFIFPNYFLFLFLLCAMFLVPTPVCFMCVCVQFTFNVDVWLMLRISIDWKIREQKKHQQTQISVMYSKQYTYIHNENQRDTQQRKIIRNEWASYFFYFSVRLYLGTCDVFLFRCGIVLPSFVICEFDYRVNTLLLKHLRKRTTAATMIALSCGRASEKIDATYIAHRT